MKRFAAALFATFCLVALPAAALGASLLTPAEIDPAHFLPPPPDPASREAQAEIAELKQLAASNTPQQIAAAAHDNGDATAGIFVEAIGSGFDLAKLPATAKLLGEVNAATDEASDAAKAFFHRDRPWIVMPAWQTCAPHGPGPARNSYPSGHATFAYATGTVLASLLLDKAQAILKRSAVFAENRLICGFHFRTDIVAGQVLGTTVVRELMQNPQFRAEYDAAAAELTAAHLR